MTLKTTVKTVLCALVLAAAAASFWVVRKAHAKSNTNISVESDGKDFLKDKRESEDRFGIPIDESTAIEFTDDGEPAVRRSF